MDAGRLGLGAQHHQAPVGQPAVRRAGHRAGHLARDQIVLQQNVGAGVAAVEDVGDVLAVGRAEGALELHAAGVEREDLVGAGREGVAAGEDQAVAFGQLLAGQANGIDAHRLAGLAVEHQVAEGRFTVRLDLEQDARRQDGEVDVGVVKALGRVVDRFTEDAGAGRGVVLELDGEVAADALDEDLVVDVDVRMRALDVLFPGGARPGEVVGDREDVVALALVVEVLEAFVGAPSGQRPAQHAQVAESRAGLESRQQQAVGAPQVQQPCVLVILEDLAEILLERRLGQQSGRMLRVEVGNPGAVIAQFGEDVGDAELALQPEEHLVAEQQAVADIDDVARDAVVLGAHPRAGQQPCRHPAEQLQASGVELPGEIGQALALLVEPGADDLEGAGIKLCVAHGILKATTEAQRATEVAEVGVV